MSYHLAQVLSVGSGSYLVMSKPHDYMMWWPLPSQVALLSLSGSLGLMAPHTFSALPQEKHTLDLLLARAEKLIQAG